MDLHDILDQWLDLGRSCPREVEGSMFATLGRPKKAHMRGLIEESRGTQKDKKKNQEAHWPCVLVAKSGRPYGPL